AEHAASLFNLQTFGNVYTRLSNPTTAVFEERMAAIENGRAAVATASGQAAEMVALLNILENGDHVVSSSKLYGGTYTMLAVNFKKFGIEATLVDPDDPENFRRALKPNTKAIFSETLGNPAINVIDIAAVGAIAREAGVPFIVDNTAASPYLCQPLAHGADIVVHSATKFIGGHGTSMGGVVVESGKFPWDNGKFPTMTEPSVGYHGVKFYETFGDFGFTMKARMEVLRVFGPAISPFNSWLLLQGLETLPVRMERHVANAMGVARFLRDHPKVSWVNYPGLPENKYHAAAKRYMPKGAGSLLAFGIKGGFDAGVKFIEGLTIVSHLANIGDAKSLVIHPASTTHRQLGEEELKKAGVPPDMVRLSIGLESLDDILWDIDRALASA
ncbi:MAG: O-acetylhomoserine aminocarboxypropyltransferase/cysteine synthase family protein, partial [Usitatibacter sp.]